MEWCVNWISGKYGGEGNTIYIRYIEFKTSERTENYGIVNLTDTAFALPVGVFFGSGSSYVHSLGTYEIASVIEPTVTVTSTVASTANSGSIESQCPSNSSFVTLSYSTGILGFYFYYL